MEYKFYTFQCRQTKALHQNNLNSVGKYLHITLHGLPFYSREFQIKCVLSATWWWPGVMSNRHHNHNIAVILVGKKHTRRCFSGDVVVCICSCTTHKDSERPGTQTVSTWRDICTSYPTLLWVDSGGLWKLKQEVGVDILAPTRVRVKFLAKKPPGTFN